MNQIEINALIEKDQYTRLDILQQQLDHIEDQHVESLIEKAKLLSNEGDLQGAAEVLDVAVLGAIAVDEPTMLTRAITAQSRNLFAVGENQRGIHYALQALNSLRRQMSSREARTFFEENDLEFGVALVDAKTIHEIDASLTIQVLTNVEQVYEKYGYELGLAYALIAKGSALKHVLQMEDAFVSYLRALGILRKYEMYIADLLLDLSYVCSSLNQLDEAQAYLDEAEEIYEEEGNELGLAAVYVNQAAYLRRKGQLKNLARIYRHAHGIYQEHDRVEDTAFVDMNVGTLLQIYPLHPEQSLLFLERALAAYEGTGNNRLAMKVKGYMAFAYDWMGMRGQARDLFLEIVEHEETSADAMWKACYMLANIELAEGNLLNAKRHLLKGIETIDSMRASLRTEELIVDALDLKPDFYGPLVSLTEKMGESIEAIGWAEQAKSRAFLHLLGNTKFAVPASQDLTMVAQIDDLDARIGIVHQTIHLDTGVESIELIHKRQGILRQLVATRERLRRQLKISNSEAASMVNVQPLDWTEMKSLLVS